MGFIFTDLVVESIIRDGLADMRAKLSTSNDQVPDLFSEMLASHLSVKYGSSEIAKIESMVLNNDIAVVHAFAQIATSIPCISLQLVSNSEDESLAGVSDFAGNADVSITPTIYVSGITCDSYDPIIGVVDMSSANPNLAQVRTGNMFQDGTLNKYEIIGAIDNTLGHKTIAIEKGLTLNLTGCSIMSATSIERRETKYIPDRESIMIGLHTENALQTKYLYNIVKYILVSRKDDLIQRGAGLISLEASDFTFDISKLPDNVFTRSITARLLVYHTFRTGLVQLVDSVDTIIRTQRRPDQFPREDENNQTVRTFPDPELEP